MNKNKKGQGATEYLIILAVVIIITLIVVGVMGGLPGIGGINQRLRIDVIDAPVSNDYGDWMLKCGVLFSSWNISTMELFFNSSTDRYDLYCYSQRKVYDLRAELVLR